MKLTSYEAVKEKFGLSFRPGMRVRHDETGQTGTVRKPHHKRDKHVRVQFDGASFTMPCYPPSLIKERRAR